MLSCITRFHCASFGIRGCGWRWIVVPLESKPPHPGGLGYRSALHIGCMSTRVVSGCAPCGWCVGCLVPRVVAVLSSLQSPAPWSVDCMDNNSMVLHRIHRSPCGPVDMCTSGSLRQARRFCAGRKTRKVCNRRLGIAVGIVHTRAGCQACGQRCIRIHWAATLGNRA